MNSSPGPVTARSARQYTAWKIQPADSNYFAFTVDPIEDKVPFVQVIEIFEVGGKTPPNSHVQADEHFYVLHGQGVATCNGARIDVKPGATRLYCLTTMVPNEAFAELIRNGIPWQLDETDYAVLEGRAS